MRWRISRAAWPILGLFWLGGCKNIEEGQAKAGAVGATCGAADDCTEVEDDPVCLKMPGGYCSAECSGGFFDCDDQSICEQMGDRAIYCLDGCLTDNGNGDCRDEYRCSARPEVINADGREVGVCVPKCEQDADCETGRRCDTSSGDCVARGEKSTGDTCSNNGSCNGGLCIKSTNFRGGYCSGLCGSQFADCEPGSHCVTLEDKAVCLSGCSGDSDCRGSEGYICRKVAEKADSNGDAQPVKACVPRCQSDQECGDGKHCDAGTGLCADGAGDPNPIGAFCAGNGDCQSGDCLRADGWLNGYCTDDCGGGCGAGKTCADTPVGQKCLTSCNGPLDCRPGYVCGDNACRAACQGDGDCAGGSVCSKSRGVCVVPSEGGTVELVDLGSVSVGGELSDDLELDVPDDAVGFAVLASGAGEDLMVIGEMTDPDGRSIYDFQDPFGSEVRFFPSEDQITQFVPSSPRSTPKAGTYTFNLIKEGATRNIKVSALIKSAAGDPTRGQVDVNFFFAKISDLNADRAQTDGDFQAAVDEMRTIWGRQGVDVGDISYCNLSGSDADRYAVIDSVDGPSSELSRMFKLSENAGALGCAAEGAINFFMVQEIVGGRAGYIILGVAGGIPGPAIIAGTSHSGVAVTTAGFRRSPTQLAQTMAHEGGHYLGLFHTTEAEGTAFDPLPDTPECDNSRDRNADGLVDSGECGSSGADNLMFWAAGDSAEKVSDDQGFILRRNPGIQ
ncbi:MAG: hypothetical protein KC620_03905 [Myxococcales bacterium]|nr:hypothetical protein [Myxococcales bacterium]